MIAVYVTFAMGSSLTMVTDSLGSTFQIVDTITDNNDQQVAATAGALVGEILSLTMSSQMLDAYGWRIAFLIGGVDMERWLAFRANAPDASRPRRRHSRWR